MAIVEAIKEVVWLRGLISDFGLHQERTNIFFDSQSAIHLTKNHMYHEITKHTYVKYHFVREVTTQGEIIVKKIATTENLANMMTKLVSVLKFKHCLDLISIRSI